MGGVFLPDYNISINDLDKLSDRERESRLRNYAFQAIRLVREWLKDDELNATHFNRKYDVLRCSRCHDGIVSIPRYKELKGRVGVNYSGTTCIYHELSNFTVNGKIFYKTEYNERVYVLQVEVLFDDMQLFVWQREYFASECCLRPLEQIKNTDYKDFPIFLADYSPETTLEYLWHTNKEYHFEPQSNIKKLVPTSDKAKAIYKFDFDKFGKLDERILFNAI